MRESRMENTRPFYWSLRRELWENRWVYLIPLLVAGVVLVSFILSLFVPGGARTVGPVGEMQRGIGAGNWYGSGAMYVMAATLFAAFYYSSEALQTERRDRSIMFWKSMPVSDLTTVSSKAVVPLLILPLFGYAVTLATQLMMLIVHSLVLLATTGSTAALWSNYPLLQLWPVVFYFGLAAALWHAPFYGWLLLVSAAVQRAALVWAIVPLVALGVAERVIFGSTYVRELLGYRWTGMFQHAFAFTPGVDPTFDRLPALTPLRLLATPGFWGGLAFTGACILLAAYLRRHRQPA